MGGPLHVERFGTGTPLVLLHGIGHHWQAWLPVLDRLAEVHTVYAVDLPGHGRSPLPPGGLPGGMADAVELVARFCARAGLHRPHMAGNSLGGALALELGAAGLAASVTAFAPAGFCRPWEARLALGQLRVLRAASRLPEPLVRRALRPRVGRAVCFGLLLGHPTRIPAAQALRDTVAFATAGGFAPIAAHADRYAFTGTVPVPVTVAWGTRDRILLPYQAGRARLRLPAAEHVQLRGAGHVPMFDEPQRVAALILATAARAELAGDRVGQSSTDSGVTKP